MPPKGDQPLLDSEGAAQGNGQSRSPSVTKAAVEVGRTIMLRTSPQSSAMTTVIKSTDGKFHQFAFNAEAKTLTFTLLSPAMHPTKHALTIALSEVLSIRSEPVKLRRGLPVIHSNGELYQRESAGPNFLYIYYGFRNNIYTWRTREATVIFTSTAEKRQWTELLQQALKDEMNRPKLLLVFINPYGGKGKANEIYSKQVEPLLKLVGIDCEIIRTERANHAHDVLKELDHEKWSSINGIVSVGGDGLFNEVLSSTVIRTQEEHNKDIQDADIDALATPRLRFGIIGAGSANSIVSSVHGIDDCSTAAMHIALGSECGVDVCTVHEENQLLRISANAISYGWLGDVLHDSESYRCMGPIRYQYSALRTSIRHPTYFGRVTFSLNAPRDDTSGGREGATSPVHPSLPPCTSPCDICEGKVTTQHQYHWQTDFTHVICCVVPCISPFTPYGLAPYAGVGDGSMDLALVPKVSRCENIKIMSTVALYGAKQLIKDRSDNVHVFRVSRWTFTPTALLKGHELAHNEEQLEKQRQGAWNLDGEILPQPTDKSLHFRLHARLIRFFGKELDLDDPRYRKCLCCCAKPKRHSNLVVFG